MDIHEGKRIREQYQIKGARKFIAARMSESLRDYPQGTGSRYICTEPLIRLKEALSAENPHVTMTSLLTKITAETLTQHPLLNSALIGNEEFFIYDSVNIGVGVGLDEGIMMVVIREVQNKNIFEISDELQDKIAKLKAKKLQMTDMMGSTFTLSNMGMLGVEQVTPFLNPPETGILAVGTTTKHLVVDERDNSTAIKPMTCFSITINHAAIDGLHGGLFLLSLKKVLEAPEMHLGLP